MRNLIQRTTKTTWIIVFVFMLAVAMLRTASADPNAPSNLTVSVPSNGTVTLRWIDNSNNKGRFYVYYRRGSAGTFTNLGTPSANSTSYTRSGLSCGTHEFKIYAYEGGWSSPSNIISADPCGTPPPTGSCDTLHGGSSFQLEHNFSYTSQSGDVINVSICTTPAYQANYYNGNINAAMQDIQNTAVATDSTLFNLLGSGFNNAVSGGSTENLIIALYANETEYGQLFGFDFSGFYQSRDRGVNDSDNTIYIYDHDQTDHTDPTFPLLISHEYSHYLLWRYVMSSDYIEYYDASDDVNSVYYPQWMDEGVSEYVAYEVVFGNPYNAFTQFYSNVDSCNFTYETILEGLSYSYFDSTALIYYMFAIKNVNTNSFFQYMKNQLLDGEYNYSAGDYLVVTNYLTSIGITADGFEAWCTAEFDTPADNARDICNRYRPSNVRYKSQEKTAPFTHSMDVIE